MFDTVYNKAKESKGFKELKEQLKNLHIDARSKKDGFFVTVAAQLAKDGTDYKVEWMRHLGANVNEIAFGYALAKNHEKVKDYLDLYGASIDCIAYGYACVGDHEKVEEYRKAGASIDSIARGYACGEYDKEVEEYRKDGATIESIALGYALAENHEKVEEYCKKDGVGNNLVVLGYACVANHDYVEKYRKDASDDYIASCYALAGNHNKVKEYCKEGAKIDNVATVYACAGNHDKVAEYRKAGVRSYEIASAYAFAGYHEKVEKIRIQQPEYPGIYKRATINFIACGYAMAGNHKKVADYRIQYDADVSEIASVYKHGKSVGNKEYINCLLDSYLKERTEINDSRGVTVQYFYGSFFSQFQKSFAQKSDAVSALKSALNGEAVDLSKHLSTLRNGKLGQELRAFVKSGMGNALVDGKKVNTVRDFVQALQDKLPLEEVPSI